MKISADRLQLVQSENQRRALAAADPPFHGAVEGFEMRRVRLLDQAKDIEIRMFGVKLFRRRRAVQDHRLQIVRRRSLEFLHEFVELMIDQSFLPSGANLTSSRSRRRRQTILRRSRQIRRHPRRPTILHHPTNRRRTTGRPSTFRRRAVSVSIRRTRKRDAGENQSAGKI